MRESACGQEVFSHVKRAGFGFFLWSALASWACLCAVWAAESGEKELEGIKKKIEAEQRGISRVKKNEGTVRGALEKMDQELEKKNRELKQITNRLEIYQGNLQRAEAQINEIQSSLRLRRELLERRLRALYKWERSGGPWMLFNGDLSAAEMMRRKRYLATTLARDQELIEQYASESARQHRLRGQVEQKTQELSVERGALVKVNESIRLEKRKKQEFLLALRKEKETHAKTLKELEQAALRLQKMLDEMSRRAPGRSVPGVGFEAKRGLLEYPVRGTIVEGFGKTKHPDFSAEVFRKGVDIEASLGDAVKVVEAGTIIFADRFSGYGKMVIVDHGQRYYTVYAHLGEIRKDVGQTVQKGETIASVGDSDTQKGARLYFEIRKDGKALDPVVWLRPR